MIVSHLVLIAISGFFSGILAGLFGIGGGTLLVPLLITLGYEPTQVFPTSALAISITAVSGTVQNWRMGLIKLQNVLYLGIPALIAAQLGVYLAEGFSSAVLLFAFGWLLIINFYLVEFRQQVIRHHHKKATPLTDNPLIARITTGGAAGILAGLFGVGGGVIMVPLQILWLGESIKAAIQNSLGVIVFAAVSACIGHGLQGNILFLEGLVLGTGGLLGAQVSTRFLPKLPNTVVSFAFRSLLIALASYTFWQSWRIYQGF